MEFGEDTGEVSGVELRAELRVGTGVGLRQG